MGKGATCRGAAWTRPIPSPTRAANMPGWHETRGWWVPLVKRKSGKKRKPPLGIVVRSTIGDSALFRLKQNWNLPTATVQREDP